MHPKWGRDMEVPSARSCMGDAGATRTGCWHGIAWHNMALNGTARHGTAPSWLHPHPWAACALPSHIEQLYGAGLFVGSLWKRGSKHGHSSAAESLRGGGGTGGTQSIADRPNDAPHCAAPTRIPAQVPRHPGVPMGTSRDRWGPCRRSTAGGTGGTSPAQGAAGTPVCGRQCCPWGRGGGTDTGRGMRPAGCRRLGPPGAPSWGGHPSPAWRGRKSRVEGGSPPPVTTTNVKGAAPGDPNVPGEDFPAAACGEAWRC